MSAIDTEFTKFMISKGEASEFQDFKEIGRCGILERFGELLEVKKKAFLMLVDSFENMPEAFAIADWIYYIVVPGEYEVWEASQNKAFEQWVYEENMKSERETKKIKQIQREDEEFDVETLQEELLIILLEQDSDCLDMDPGEALERRQRDIQRIRTIEKELRRINPDRDVPDVGTMDYARCLSMGGEIGEDLAYLWAIDPLSNYL